jgi:hypothetical protein
MKKETIFKDKIILSQVEIALLLNVPRSQWAMFLHDKRDLPAHAKINLGQLIKGVNAIEAAKAKKLIQETSQEAQMPKWFEKMLKANELKQLKVKKELHKIESQYHAAKNTLHLIALITIENDAFVTKQDVIAVIKKRALKQLQSCGLATQEHLKIKLAVLKHEKKLLESDMKKLG